MKQRVISSVDIELATSPHLLILMFKNKRCKTTKTEIAVVIEVLENLKRMSLENECQKTIYAFETLTQKKSHEDSYKTK